MPETITVGCCSGQEASANKGIGLSIIFESVQSRLINAFNYAISTGQHEP